MAEDGHEPATEISSEKRIDFTLQIVDVAGIDPARPVSVELCGFVGSAVKSDSSDTRWKFNDLERYEFSKPLDLEQLGAKERPRLLDAMCTDPVVANIYDGDVLLGTARATLEKLIHDTHDDAVDGSAELSVPIIWTPKERAADADADVVEGEKDDKGEDAEAEPPGTLALIATVSERIGRTYCPEDVDDWAKITVQVHGLYSLPEKLVGINQPIPKHVGIVEDHPFSYHFRMMGCVFDNGYIYNPPRNGADDSDDEDKPPEGENAANTNVDENAAPKEEEDDIHSSSSRVALPEFAEGLIRIGYTAPYEDVAEVFEFLDVNHSGFVGIAEFTQLQAIDTPAELDVMVAFREFLLSKHDTLRDAFDSFPKVEGSDEFDLQGLESGLATIEYDGENVVSIFLTLDIQRTKVVSWAAFQTLHLFAVMHLIQNVEKQRDWILNTFGDVHSALQQIDDNNSGRVSFDEWEAAMERFAYPDEESKFSGFNFMDAEHSKIVDPRDFKKLALFDGTQFLKELKKFCEYFFSLHHNLATTFEEMCGEGRKTLKGREFRTACKRLGYEGKMDTRVVHNFLDINHNGRIAASDFLLLRAFNSAAAKGSLPQFKNYIMERFADLKEAFVLMFGDTKEFYEVAENQMPRVEFEQATTSAYVGREWLQQFYNILNDPRGRVKVEDTQTGGVWLYMFPKLKETELPLGDYKEAADPEKARIARWHHGQMFVDLRKFRNDEEVIKSSSYTFRAFVARVRQVTNDVNEADDLPRAPFEVKRTYMKVTVSFDRILSELCPRDVPPLDPEYVPNKPPPPPEKSVIEQFDDDIRLLIARLATSFGHAAKAKRLVKPQVCGPSGECSEYARVGPLGLERFLDFLMNSGQWAMLLGIIRSCIANMMKERMEVEESLPQAGLYGDERDAKYSTIRDELVSRMMQRLNEEIQKQRWRRDTKLWRNPPLYGDGDDNFWEPEDLKIQQLARCKELQRLVFECEMYGDHERATEFFKERLQLPHNVQEPSQWHKYARFLMRCGQKQLQAEQALRYSMSLTSVEEADEEAILFLACCLLNRTGKSSIPDAPRNARFHAALTLFTTFSARNPTNQTGNFFMYLLYAMEAKFKQDEGVQDSERDVSYAAKYLKISKAPPEFFSAILPSLRGDGQPNFPELANLYSLERVSRGELQPKSPREKMDTPAAWLEAPFPAFCRYEHIHKAPLDEDEVVLDAIDKVLQFGMPNFVRFLIREGTEVYGFISEQTRYSDRCRMQLVKAHMMLGEFEEAAEVCNALLHDNSDRLVEAWILLGESEYRMALEHDVPPLENPYYQRSLEAFEEALKFLPSDHFKDPYAQKILKERTTSDAEVSNRDPVIFIRAGSVYYARGDYATAKDMYRRSLEQAPTAEGWRNAGVAAYRLGSAAKRNKDPVAEDGFFSEAFTCLLEANIMDNTRPKIWAWLSICAVEKGERNLAKQAFRHAARSGLDWETATELADRFLHFSDIQNAEYEGGAEFVKHGLYAKEATILLNQVLTENETGEAHLALGRALTMQGLFPEALVEMRLALAWFFRDEAQVDKIFEYAKDLAARLNEQPQLVELLKQDVLLAEERRQDPDAEIVQPLEPAYICPSPLPQSPTSRIAQNPDSA
eukprot:GEMP01001242.1.p1 GENE.GEMP01001242.1~~GEMP01001242.1.p1  ORF type:complete len:1621 (+),score=446.88 GEMP01001242.1:61-4923(+)